MKIHIDVHGLELTTELEKYASAKIARLNKRVPRGFRAESICKVDFVQKRKKGTKFNTCTITIVLNGTELKAEETTLHMYTALDVAAVHMERQLVDFGAKHGKRSLGARLRRYFRAD